MNIKPSRQANHLPWLSAKCVCVSLCREKAKGATFFEATEGETVRPMLDVSWAPMLGAFSVLFEEFSAGTQSHSRPKGLHPCFMLGLLSLHAGQLDFSPVWFIVAAKTCN